MIEAVANTHNCECCDSPFCLIGNASDTFFTGDESMYITFLPLNKRIQAKTGANLLETARENGIDLGGTCSGKRYCGKCRVYVTKGNSGQYAKEELKLLTEKERESGMRLACCLTVTQDICVVIPGRGTENEKKGHQEFLAAGTDKRRTNRSGHRYGAAIDIGTTSVAGELWDLTEKRKLAQLSRMNPQSIYGTDVISRITYANASEANRETLTELIRGCCNEIIKGLAVYAGIPCEDIISITVAGNTTMSHLFLGKTVESLARMPFQGVSHKSEERKAKALGILIHPDGEVYIMPGIGGHVGSDTLGCILSTGMAHSKGKRLMVDIGTNGEIVLAEDGKLTACSTAAGPAFEGACLHQGMRAEEGAITAVHMAGGVFEVDFIGAGKPHVVPKGICGSGVIEAVSELLANGIMDESGRLLGEAGDRNQVALWQGPEGRVILTQKDIRELQLAKGAIFAGIRLLLKAVRPSDRESAPLPDRIYLAGAFGSSVNISKAVSIGLLPDIGIQRIEYIGNGALNGAVKILLGEISREEAEQISFDTEHLELAQCSDFEEMFVEALSFPFPPIRHDNRNHVSSP